MRTHLKPLIGIVSLLTYLPLYSQTLTSSIPGAQGDNPNIFIGNSSSSTDVPNEHRAGIWLDNDGQLKFRNVTSKGFAFRNTPNTQDLVNITENGNLGIGTTTPQYKLDVVQNLRVGAQGGNDYTLIGGGANVGSQIKMFYADGSENTRLTGNNDSWLNATTGNVGIGTTTPGYKLDTRGSGRFYSDYWPTSSALNTGGAAFALLGGGAPGDYGAPADKYPLRLYENYGWNFTLQNITNNPGNSAYSAFRVKSTNATGWNDGTLFQVRADGNVGIGTENPDSKLTVAGKIHSQEVKVTITAGADYVFEKKYQLKPLQEIEAYVKENKHLPEVASANEMEKEGVNLGEMNIQLLKKIEELTLYMIEQNKKIELLSKEMEGQKQVIKELQKK